MSHLDLHLLMSNSYSFVSISQDDSVVPADVNGFKQYDSKKSPVI